MPEKTADNLAATTATSDKNVPGDKNKTGKPRNIAIFGIFALVLIILIGAFSYATFVAGKNKKQSTPSSAKTGSTEAAKTKTSSGDKTAATYCTSGQVYENKKQGYKVCLIKGWQTREFDNSAASVGFDPNPIPEASEYGGIIVVNVTNKTTSDVSNTINNDLEGETSSSVNVDGIVGTQISGSIPADSFYYAGYKEVASIFSKFKRTYEVTTISAPDKLTTNQGLYNDFLASWRFLSGTPNPPWSDSGNILVENPWPGDEIGNPVIISGKALVFEGTVSIRIKDANGAVLANTFAQAQSGVELSDFSKSVSYTASTTTAGTVEVFSISAKDGSEQDKVTILVKFK